MYHSRPVPDRSLWLEADRPGTGEGGWTGGNGRGLDACRPCRVIASAGGVEKQVMMPPIILKLHTRKRQVV